MKYMKTFKIFESYNISRTIIDFVKSAINGDDTEIDKYISEGGNLGLGLVRSYKNIRLMKKFLNLGADINYHTKNIDTVLTWCVYNNLYNNVVFLLKNGADPNLDTPLFKTLHIDTKNNYRNGDKLKMIKLLISYGADIAVIDKKEKYPPNRKPLLFPEKITSNEKEILKMIKKEFPEEWEKYQLKIDLDKFNI